MPLPLLSLLGGPVVKMGMGIIDKLIPDPEAKAKAQAQLLKLEQDGEFREMEASMQAIMMEAQSQHRLVALARPAFLYVMYIMILGAIPMGFLAAFDPAIAKNVTTGMTDFLAAIPQEMWALFGAGYLGYVNKRSGDKQTMLGKEPKQGLFSKLLG
jgi:holin (3TMs family)